MKIFASQWTPKIDDKGRVSIPAQFRKVFDAEGATDVAVMRNLNDLPCLDGMTPGRVEQMSERVLDDAATDPIAHSVLAMTVGETRFLSMEETGRVVMPKELRDHAGLKGPTVLFLGLARTFQIWDPDVYAEWRPKIFEMYRANSAAGRQKGAAA